MPVYCGPRTLNVISLSLVSADLAGSCCWRRGPCLLLELLTLRSSSNRSWSRTFEEGNFSSVTLQVPGPAHCCFSDVQERERLLIRRGETKMMPSASTCSISCRALRVACAPLMQSLHDGACSGLIAGAPVSCTTADNARFRSRTPFAISWCRRAALVRTPCLQCLIPSNYGLSNLILKKWPEAQQWVELQGLCGRPWHAHTKVFSKVSGSNVITGRSSG